MIVDAHGFWLASEGPVEEAPVLTDDGEADVVVVGGGYAGMWTAWLLREADPGLRVVLLEGGVCGEGPSGRNGGFCNSMWFSVPSMRERFGDAAAIAIARAAQQAVDEVGEWCSKQGVDASFRRGGYMQVSTAPAFDATWRETIRSCRELGEPGAVHELDGPEVRARCASPIFRGAAFFPGSATVNPAKLARALRLKLIEAGVVVHERSKVAGIEAGAHGVVARTAGGAVRARRAILATGGAQSAVGPLGSRLTLTSSHMVMTEPVPDLLEEIGWTGGECITDARHMLHYFRTTEDGRIAFGWGGGRVVAGARLGGHADVDEPMSAQVGAHLTRFFPQLRGARLAHAWGGPIDVSPSHTPIVGTLDGRVHYAFGFTGNGVGPSRMVARCLASLALDRRDEHSRLAIVEPPAIHVPPEPFRYAGGTVIRAALLAKERAEEENRRPHPLARLLSGIPERVGVQIGR